MGQAEAKLADSEMCCGGKRSRDRNNNRLGQNPRPAQNEGSIFNFGMNDENQENHPNRFSPNAAVTPANAFIEPTPREQAPRRGVVAMKAPKFTVVAESVPAHPEPNQSLLNEIVNHPQTGTATPLGARPQHQPNSLPAQKPNWTPPYSNGAQGRHSTSTSNEYSRSYNSSNASYDTERLSASYESTGDSASMSRSSLDLSGPLYSATNRFSWNGTPSTASSRTLDYNSPALGSAASASDKARTVSNSPFASLAPANPLAARGQLPQGALPRLKTPKGKMSTGSEQNQVRLIPASRAVLRS
jgi:hypothetical protein